MIEWIATILSLLGVLFNVKKKRVCFLIWLVANSLWIYVQIKANIYGMALCQVVFNVTCIWGYIMWGKEDVVIKLDK